MPTAQQARRNAAISIRGTETGPELARFTADVARGQYEVQVSNTARLRPGMTVVIECRDEADTQGATPPAPGAPSYNFV